MNEQINLLEAVRMGILTRDELRRIIEKLYQVPLDKPKPNKPYVTTTPHNPTTNTPYGGAYVVGGTFTSGPSTYSSIAQNSTKQCTCRK